MLCRLGLKLHEHIIQLTKVKARNKHHNNNLNPTPFKVNDIALVRIYKLGNKMDKKISNFFHFYGGPFKIKTIKFTNAYELVHSKMTHLEAHNIVFLKSYVAPGTPGRSKGLTIPHPFVSIFNSVPISYHVLNF